MMKKFVKVGVALLLGLLLDSCSKPKEQKMQEVRFYANCIETGSMTRATDHNEILNLIESTYSAFPVGTFKVTGYSTPTTIGQPSSRYRLAKTPLFYTDSYVAIEYGTYEYFLPTEVRAAAIVIDLSEVHQLQFMGQTGSYITMTDSDFTTSEHYAVFFVNGIFSGTEKVGFKVIPKTGANKETEFMFAADQISTGAATYVKLEMGKYYVLHPNPVTEISGVSFSLDIPTWECGLE